MTQFKERIIGLLISLMVLGVVPGVPWARGAVIDSSVYGGSNQGKDEIVVEVFIKESLYSSRVVDAIKEVEEERSQYLQEAKYSAEYDMCKDLGGSFYARSITINSDYIIQAWLSDNYQGDADHLPNLFPNGYCIPLSSGQSRLVTYQFILFETAINLTLTECELPGDAQTYLTYLRLRYPIFPEENELDENAPESYILTNLGDTGMVVDSAIPDSYACYMKSDPGNQTLPITFSDNQIQSLLRFRERELGGIISDYKANTGKLKTNARMGIIGPIFDDIWPQIESLGGTLVGTLMTDGYPYRLSYGSFMCTIPATAVKDLASIPEVEEISGLPEYELSDTPRNDSSSNGWYQYSLPYSNLALNQGFFYSPGFFPSVQAPVWAGDTFYSQPLSFNIQPGFTYTYPLSFTNTPYDLFSSANMNSQIWNGFSSQGLEYGVPSLWNGASGFGYFQPNWWNLGTGNSYFLPDFWQFPGQFYKAY